MGGINKQPIQLVLLITAVIIGLASLLYTNKLVKKMSRQEQIKAKMLADAWTQIVNSSELNTNLDFYAGVIEGNETIPVIVTDSENNIIFTRNLDTARLKNENFVRKQLRKMRENADPITVSLPPSDSQYLFYNKSVLLIRLQYYPYFQLGIIILFITVAYLAFRASRKFEQNQVWIGLSKETAHQLGTPISSLLAWVEMMKIRNSDKEMMVELEKDVSRLEKITERFSKIGSKPVLIQHDVTKVINTAVDYLKTRSSDKVKFILDIPKSEIIIPLHAALFEWVIENLCKNAIDAMQGQGIIGISIVNFTNNVQIDISDNGKGIPYSMFKTIFKPGYTTKKKGWGLGLSLVKRIVEEYHAGKIFISHSEINKGTIFRIILKK